MGRDRLDDECSLLEPCTLCLFSGYTAAQRPFARCYDGKVVCHPEIQPPQELVTRLLAATSPH